MIKVALQSKPEYYQDLVARIAQTKPGDRIALASMDFEPHLPEVAAVMDALCAAAKRDVQVQLLVDYYIFLIGAHASPQPLFFAKPRMREWRTTKRGVLLPLQHLAAAGGHYRIINQPDRGVRNPFGGRSHLKFAVINNRVYVGGCNLNTATQVDLMATWHSAVTADWLFDMVVRIGQSGSVRQALHDDDQQLRVDDYSTLLVDAGLPGHSIIMDKALALIDQAKEFIVISCQYFPNDKTARHLRKAHERGVRVRIVYNHPSAHPFPHNLLHSAVVRGEHRRLPAQLFRDELPKGHPFLHAKLLATDRGALIGSHNYVLAGVHFGTAEIALLRRDPQFAREAIAKLAGQLRRPV